MPRRHLCRQRGRCGGGVFRGHRAAGLPLFIVGLNEHFLRSNRGAVPVFVRRQALEAAIRQIHRAGGFARIHIQIDRRRLGHENNLHAGARNRRSVFIRYGARDLRQRKWGLFTTASHEDRATDQQDQARTRQKSGRVAGLHDRFEYSTRIARIQARDLDRPRWTNRATSLGRQLSIVGYNRVGGIGGQPFDVPGCC